jgi:secreted PhoX family phosphatase
MALCWCTWTLFPDRFMDRRRFLHTLALTATAPALPSLSRAADPKIGPLRPDPGEILDLPDGYSYTIVSRAGDVMDDGLRVPHAHDGMAAFEGADGRIVLVCNHELGPAHRSKGAFAADPYKLPRFAMLKVYDAGGGTTPCSGGTTTTVYDPVTHITERQHLSLAGTELNCAGGPTPWGTWLTCEECFESPGRDLSGGRVVHRDRWHGYVFEVPASEQGLVEPVPIKAMGKFEHEAAAVHERSGIVYMTEDRHHSLFYRYIPKVPGQLHKGGKLQALAIDGHASVMTHNWSREPDIVPGESVAVRWIDLEYVDPKENNLRLRGAAEGAATFARGEGLCTDGENFAFTCTIGGPARLGQVFAYQPSPYEGQAEEQDDPGALTLIAESTHESILRNADNITFAPWGDLIVCEDTSSHCGLVGIRPDGSQYQLADNAYSKSELAGVCFSPDGKVLFVNIQYPGMTLAITGPFPT